MKINVEVGRGVKPGYIAWLYNVESEGLIDSGEPCRTKLEATAIAFELADICGGEISRIEYELDAE